MKERKFARPSAAKTASALILSGGGYLYGIAVRTNGVDAVRISAMDSITNAGRALVPPNYSFAASGVISWDNHPIPVDNGIYIGASSAGTFSFMAYYREI